MKGENKNEFEGCPNCGEDYLIIMEDWVSKHSKEALLHCEKCDSIFLIEYKFEKMWELKKVELKQDNHGGKVGDK